MVIVHDTACPKQPSQTWAFLCVPHAKSGSCPPTAPWSACAAPALCMHPHKTSTTKNCGSTSCTFYWETYWKLFREANLYHGLSGTCGIFCQLRLSPTQKKNMPSKRLRTILIFSSSFYDILFLRILLSDKLLTDYFNVSFDWFNMMSWHYISIQK